jgi:hypothetical protein
MKHTNYITQLVGISPEELMDMQLDHADEFLKEVMQCNEYNVSVLKQSKEFWDWWINIWEETDKKVFPKVECTKNWVKVIKDISNDEPIYWSNIKVLIGGAHICTKGIVLVDCVPLHEFINTYKKYHSPQFINAFPHTAIIEESFKMMTHKLVKNATSPVYK